MANNILRFDFYHLKILHQPNILGFSSSSQVIQADPVTQLQLYIEQEGKANAIHLEALSFHTTRTKVPLEITYKALLSGPAEHPTGELHLLPKAKVENRRQMSFCREKGWSCFLTQPKTAGKAYQCDNQLRIKYVASQCMTIFIPVHRS